MLKRSLKCIILNKLFSCLVFCIFLQRIPSTFTENVSEDFDIEPEPVEKVDISPYIYPLISFLNLSGIDVAPKKTGRDLNSKLTSSIETKNLTERFEEVITESFNKYKEKDSNLSQEIEKSLGQIQPRSEILKDDEEKNGNFLMKLLFNFYIKPILTFYKPLLNEEVKYYKNLINVNKQFSNDTGILSSILNDAIINNNNHTNEDSKMTIIINDSELKDANLSLRTVTNSTDFDTENDSVFQMIPRWEEIFQLTMNDETKASTPSNVEITTDRNADNLLKAEIFFKPVEIPTSTELPKLSFTNNTSILALFRPGEIPRINIKKDPNPAVSFKIKFPLIINNTNEKNNSYNDHNGAYIFDTAIEIPASDNSDSLTQEVYNPMMSTSDLQVSNETSRIFQNSNESDAVRTRILYSAEGSMIPGMLEITTTTTALPPLSLKTAPRDLYKSRMQPTFSSRYSANSTTNKSVIEPSTTGNGTENISTTDESLMNKSINSTLVPDDQQVENATKSNFFAEESLTNSTVVSTSEEMTLASSSEIHNDTKTKSRIRDLRKRELPISDQYDVNDRQELASYFYNGKKIHESYLNYANSIDHELPQDFVQHQDKLSERTDLSSLGNEVIYQKNQENSQIVESGYNLQQQPTLNFDYSFTNSKLKNNVEKEVSPPEKETSTVVSVKSNSNVMNRKNKKNQKNVLNRKKVNSKRKNNRNSKIKKKNSRLTKGKVYRNSETGKNKIAKTYSSYKNIKARNNTKKKTRNNKIIKNKTKMSNQVRSKKRNTHKKNDNTRIRDLY
ncbi:MATH and LRR domain-containing protein PFE0570w-like [Chelonus insularis]|uniref:MATH and LRR domain-containing protein PFE0570w-like n=1 Tax=Chelonus insularis TaxID=460826 RepID=UPI0015892BBE|nr:MATH and LRR domain-containing protein PFE0570w-like [Chelonus insularis]